MIGQTINVRFNEDGIEISFFYFGKSQPFKNVLFLFLHAFKGAHIGGNGCARDIHQIIDAQLVEFVFGDVFHKESLIEPQRAVNACGDAQLFLDFSDYGVLCGFVQLHSAAGKIVIGRYKILHSKQLAFMDDHCAYAVVEASVGRLKNDIHKMDQPP